MNFRKKVLVVGNGIAGYFIALRLAEHRIPTVLLDATASGKCATLRNEGWLHHGTYHAVSQFTDVEALKVARRTRLGAGKILAEFPEVVERTADFSIAIVSEGLNLDHVRDRWELAGVRASEVDLSRAPEFLPGISVSSAKALFVVDDQPIHTGRLLLMLRQRFVQLGGKIVEGVATSANGHDIEVHLPEGSTRTVTPRMTVWSAGYAGVGCVRDLLAEQGIRSRLWRSHLLVAPPRDEGSWFELHDGGLGLMHHKDHVVIGVNNDVENLERFQGIHAQDVVDTILRVQARQRFDDGLERLGLPKVDQMKGAHVTSCTKVDLVADEAAGRNLKLSTLFVSPQMMVAFPGKMTEAPVLADEVVTQILDAFEAANYPMRVGDWWRFGQVVLAGPSPEKASATLTRDTVEKTHMTAERAKFEAWVNSDLQQTGLLIPPVEAVTPSRGGATVTYTRIRGEDAGGGAPGLREQVSNLSEFHYRFRLGSSPLSLYRDAADWNGLIAGGLRWEVDFSSSDHLRHMLDDVALLMESIEQDGASVPTLYQESLEVWAKRGAPLSSFPEGLRSAGVTFTAAVDSVYRTYVHVVGATTESATWKRADALRGLADVSFHELRWKDLAWFQAFRAARLRHYGLAPDPVISHMTEATSSIGLPGKVSA
ncbi:FAD-dependent oxidoreductase [Williamsia sp. 1135]|uniref:FAD-dependent oxidoreductase n=1 Tax=Williamsia sp. 1135 TaxID=1889262 RepID=UPI001439598B|nr:FAD-dependent oxidoreductase [Williamsia sp. 1135]